MQVSKELNAALNAQIGRELHSSHQYLAMAAYFEGRALLKLAELFYEQAAEEREHALKFIKYIATVDGQVQIPAVDAARETYASAEAALERALEWEKGITRNIYDLMSQAIKENDYAAQELLRWFVTEQVEEVNKMDNLLKVARQAGERSIYMVEAYLIHAD